MAWVHYVLRFRLLSPLHIGDRKMGNLMQTRPYVTGRVLWAALTARLTRDLGRGTRARGYQGIGAKIKKNFRFGYLWPSLDGETPYFPWDHDDFEYLLLGSYVSTAIDYDRQAAQEGSLHEVEFIAPVARDGRPVYLIGDLWVRVDDPWVRDVLSPELQRLWEVLNRLQLGGERTYGWGRVCLSDPKLLRGGSENTAIGGNKWTEQNG
ncbi:RAMP superfamily CRISPR-associated protein, partial [Thermoflexus sp.]|uniref:RAMP superfamily CRISPR-associated protein n=1 Tax=Thermoflexus sp. TaxID=1969742 RepID=UPI002ADE345F